MHLSLYLSRAGVTTGPLAKSSSHSSLENIKKLLLGQELFKGGEEFLTFGSALHERWLEGKSAYKLDKEQAAKVYGCLNALNNDPLAMRLLNGSTREEKLKVTMSGVEMSFILDIHRKRERIGADLKTTGVRCLSEFVDKAKEYGYFRQAATYIRAAKLKEFYFIAVTKTSSPKVFTFCVNDYPEELRYANAELDFLLYFYRHYGKFN